MTEPGQSDPLKASPSNLFEQPKVQAWTEITQARASEQKSQTGKFEKWTTEKKLETERQFENENVNSKQVANFPPQIFPSVYKKSSDGIKLYLRHRFI